VPNIALIQDIKAGLTPGGSENIKILYIGTRKGMEGQMMRDLGVPYRGISCGKLRRYFSWQNFLDIFKIPLGILQSLFILRRFKAEIIFCKGGFASYPVAVAGWILRIPVILHESDVIPGLANKLCARFSTKICVSHQETAKYFPKNKVVVTGSPLRRELALADAETARELTGFHHKEKPVLLFMGGSQGADFINNIVWKNFEKLTANYQVAHICGETKLPDSLHLIHQNKFRHEHYKAYEFLGGELKHLYALSNVVITRSGAITLAELDYFNKPAILIPLGTQASRGDQIENAKLFAKNHQAIVMHEHHFSTEDFFADLKKLASGHAKDAAALKHEHAGAHADHAEGANKFFANVTILNLLFTA